MFLKILETLAVKNKKLTVNYASIRIELTHIEELKKVLPMPIVIESLLYLTPSQAKGKYMYTFKP